MSELNDRRGVAVLLWCGPLIALQAIAPGFERFLFENADLAEQLLHGRLSSIQREGLRGEVLTSAAWVLSVQAVLLLIGRRRAWPIASSLPRVALSSSFLVFPATLRLAAEPALEEWPWLTLFFACAAGASLAATIHGLAPPVERFRRESDDRLSEGASLITLACLAGTFTWLMVDRQVLHHHAMGSGAYDLGIYTTVLWNTLQGDFLDVAFLKTGNHASAHYEPFLALISPILSIRREAGALIAFQAAWVAAGVFPLYWLARAELRRRRGARTFALVLGAAYLAHPALHGAVLFDFHTMTLSVPLFLWTVLAARERRWLAFAGALALLLSVREDMALQGFCIAAYLLIRRQGRAALGTFLVSLGWLYLVKMHLMNDGGLLMEESESSYDFSLLFRDLIPKGKGFGYLAETLATNPGRVATHTFRAERMLFYAQMLVPIGALALWAGRAWVLAAYGVALTALASKDVAYSIAFHYAAALLAPLLCLTIVGARELSAGAGVRRPRPSLTVLAAWLAGASFVSSAGFGVLLPSEREFHAGWYVVEDEIAPGELERYRALLELVEEIGPEEAVCASGFALPHFAARREIYHSPDCRHANWIVIRAHQLRRGEVDLRSELRSDPEWERVRSVEGLEAFRRRPPGTVESTRDDD